MYKLLALFEVVWNALRDFAFAALQIILSTYFTAIMLATTGLVGWLTEQPGDGLPDYPVNVIFFIVGSIMYVVQLDRDLNG